MNKKSPNSQLVKKALYYTAEKFDGLYRKGTKVPHLVHPILTTLNLLKYTFDEKMITVALLHDILEDCPQISKKDLKKMFGDKITKMVDEMSLVSKINSSKNWKTRKLSYISKIKKASPQTLMVIACDKMDNMRGYFDFVLKEKIQNISPLFKGSLPEYLWFYEEILKILKFKLKKHQSVKDYQKILYYYKQKLNRSNN